MKTKEKIGFGFKGKNQGPLFMIWKEYWENGEMVFGEVLFELDIRIYFYKKHKK